MLAPSAVAVRRRAQPVAAWRLLVIGVDLFVVGNVIYNVLLYDRPGEIFPSLADAAYLGGYVAIGLGGSRLAAHSEPLDRRLRIDVWIVLTSLVLATWLFVIEPLLPSIRLSLVWAVTLAYPAIGLVIAAFAARLMLGPVRPTIAARLVAVGAFLLVSSNLGYVALGGNIGSWVGVGSLLSYGFLAAAAVHPSTTAPPRETSVGESKTASRRISILIAVAGAPIFAANLSEAMGGRELGNAPLAGGTVILVALVAARISAVVRDEVEVRTERVVQSERINMMQGVTRLMEQERALTAAEIHDGPVQHLPSLALQLARVDLRLGRGDVAGGREIAERVRQGLEHEVADLRRLMAGLRPSMLEHGGLEAAVRDLGAELTAGAGCSVSVDSELDERLDRGTEFVLYRVAQEALTNVAKHADAQAVHVRLRGKLGRAELDVVDDGRGFLPTEGGSTNGRHFGLSAMRERVGAVGGSLHVESRPGGGTTLTAMVPIEGDAR